MIRQISNGTDRIQGKTVGVVDERSELAGSYQGVPQNDLGMLTDVLDGFPRTIPQAEVLDKALTELGDAIDFAIDVNVPDENIVKRMSGRRACLSCGATYHIEHIPPKKEGICDKCGQELVLRDDDKPETVLNRLKVYHDQTQPLIDFYTKKNVLKTVDGTKDMKEVFADIVAILG